MKTDAKAILYDQRNGKIKLIDKSEVCKLLKSFKLKESMTYKEIAEKCGFNKVSNGIYNLKNKTSTKLIFLIDKTLEEFKDFLKKNNLPIYEENDTISYQDSNEEIKINVDLKGYSASELNVLNYVLFLQIDIAKNVKDREIALVYDKNGSKNQFEQWLFSVEGAKDSDFLDLSSNTDIFHLLQPYVDAVVVVSHNHPNNKTFSLTDIHTFLVENNIKTIIAVTDDTIFILNKYNFNLDIYEKTKKELNEKLNQRYFEPYLTELRDSWLSKMETMGIEKKEIKYDGR